VIAPAVDATATTPAREYTEILYLPAHNLVQEKWTGPKLGADDSNAASVTGFDHVEVLDKMREDLSKLLTGFNRPSILTDTAVAPDTSPSTEPMGWLRRANAFPPGAGVIDVKPMLAELRVRKDAGELDLIKKATDASIAAHRLAFRMVKPGVNEHQIAAAMQGEFMMRGCERPAYAPIVGSGFYSTVLHYSADSKQIADGDTVVMDVAGEYSMYASDITRTVPANGHFTPRQREIYNVVLGAQQAAIDAFVAGRSKINDFSHRDPDTLDAAAYNYINTHGKDLHGQPLGKYWLHGLGHMVGIDVHDPAQYPAVLKPGMVFTIEPGVYIPEEKLGVRIECDFLVGSDGNLIDLDAGLPHTAEEVEAAMRK